MITELNTALWIASRASGAVATILLTGVVVLGSVSALRRRRVSGVDLVLPRVHRSISLLATVFVAIHVITAILDTTVPIGWAASLLPFTSGYQPIMVGLGTVASDLLIAVIITGLLRHRISERAFRIFHLLPLVLWPVALAHGLFTSSTDQAWLVPLTLVCAITGGAAIAWRLIRRESRDARQRQFFTIPS